MVISCSNSESLLAYESSVSLNLKPGPKTDPSLTHFEDQTLPGLEGRLTRFRPDLSLLLQGFLAALTLGSDGGDGGGAAGGGGTGSNGAVQVPRRDRRSGVSGSG